MFKVHTRITVGGARKFCRKTPRLEKRSVHAYHCNNGLVYGHNPCPFLSLRAETPNWLKLVVPPAPSDFECEHLDDISSSFHQ